MLSTKQRGEISKVRVSITMWIHNSKSLIPHVNFDGTSHSPLVEFLDMQQRSVQARWNNRKKVMFVQMFIFKWCFHYHRYCRCLTPPSKSYSTSHFSCRQLLWQQQRSDLHDCLETKSNYLWLSEHMLETKAKEHLLASKKFRLLEVILFCPFVLFGLWNNIIPYFQAFVSRMSHKC